MKDEFQNDLPTSELSNTTSRIRRREEVNPVSYKERRLNRKKNKKEDDNPKKTIWVQIRLFPIWLRIIIVLLLVGASATVGMMIGYGVIGDGEPKDVLKWETWIHILDIIQGKES